MKNETRRQIHINNEVSKVLNKYFVDHLLDSEIWKEIRLNNLDVFVNLILYFSSQLGGLNTFVKALSVL